MAYEKLVAGVHHQSEGFGEEGEASPYNSFVSSGTLHAPHCGSRCGDPCVSFIPYRLLCRGSCNPSHWMGSYFCKLSHLILCLQNAVHSFTSTVTKNHAPVCPWLLEDPLLAGSITSLLFLFTDRHHISKAGGKHRTVAFSSWDCSSVRRMHGHVPICPYCLVVMVPLLLHVPNAAGLQPGFQSGSGDFAHFGWEPCQHWHLDVLRY